ncbi:MAG TPA: hypothetical protein VNL77_17845 [Roseiflexaceae bacterium]|nr:hypothetical protein [Roseiflexaceae bacterium]
MELGVVLLTLGAYGLASYLAWQERAPAYVVALAGGHLASLASPLWQALYGFSYDRDLAPLYAWQRSTEIVYALPRPVFLAAWTLVLPALVIFFLYRRRWWYTGYLTGLLTLALFVLYHLLVETVGVRAGWWSYTSAAPLPLGVSPVTLAAIMNGLVSLGVLAALLLTRHYTLGSQLLFLLPVPLALAFVVHGLLGAPLYTVLLLRAQSWAGVIGMAGTLGLLAWGAHIVASGMAAQRGVRQPAA